jgi:ketosteroid isomerase-like protein
VQTNQSSDVSSLLQRLEEIEGRLRILEAEREIRTVLAMYGYTADCCLDQDYVDLCTEDVLFDVNHVEADGSSRMVTLTGKQELLEWMSNSNPQWNSRADYFGRSMHIQDLNVVIEVEGDIARANTYALTLGGDKNNRIVFSYAGDTSWLFRRLGERWLIAERHRRRIGTPEFATNLEPAMTNHAPSV